MATLSSIIDSIHPAVSGLNIILSDRVWVLFDRELDEESVKKNLFVTGPDQDTWSGPDLLLFHNKLEDGDEEQILQSSDYHGLVDGDITFEKIQLTSLGGYSGYDQSGNGSLWRTKAIFTPTYPFTANTEYRVYLSGEEDEDDAFTTGILTRTVFDTVPGGNVGTGEAEYCGSYTGTAATNTFHVLISVAGEAGTARFTWYRGTDPALKFGPFLTEKGVVLLGDGVKINFGDGTFEVGDNFAVVVKTGEVFTGNVTWPFTTGSGSIQELPSTTSTTVTGTPVTDSASTSATTFEVESTSPENRATNLSSILDTDFDIVITLSDTVDPATVINTTVIVNVEPVDGDTSLNPASGIIAKSIVVSGDTITLTVASGMVQMNQVVTVTLDETVASSGGVELGADYEFYFTSTYYPLYSAVRRVRLDYGAIVSQIPDDTINLAIYVASQESDQLTWATTASTIEDYYNWVRREYTTCRAAEILILNLLQQSGGLKSKRLGDLEVQYDPQAASKMLDKALACIGKWEATLHARGAGVSKPQLVTKGLLDPDRPPVGRQWTPPTGGIPVAKAKSRYTLSRRWQNGYYNTNYGRSGKGNEH